MKYDFDIVLLDTTSHKYYDYHTLENQALGGTEATVVRVMEGLAGFGLKVAVVQSKPEYFEPMTSKHAFYFHSDDLPNITCKHFIQLRGMGNSHLFPRAKKYVWLHDTANEKMKSWNEVIHENRITIIGVSKHHKKDIQKYLTTSNIEYIYNPVQDEIYKPKELELKYNKDIMVWAASPHKGLGKGLEVFKKVKERLPKMILLVANPGYLNIDAVKLNSIPGVSMMGPQSCKTLWRVLETSLCLFYPSQYDETFGLILAEANALGVPMAGYSRGVLKEVVSHSNDLAEDGNEEMIVEQVLDWHTNGRPLIEGRKEFKLSSVVFKWIQLLGNKGGPISEATNSLSRCS